MKGKKKVERVYTKNPEMQKLMDESMTNVSKEEGSSMIVVFIRTFQFFFYEKILQA